MTSGLFPIDPSPISLSPGPKKDVCLKGRRRFGVGLDSVVGREVRLEGDEVRGECGRSPGVGLWLVASLKAQLSPI